MPERDRMRVGISGSYGGLNLGDEAILHGIVAELRRARPVELTVFSRDAEHTRRHHEVERAVDARSLSRVEARKVIEELDLFILGGGGLLYDADAELYLREVIVARELGVPVMLCAVSAGPLRDRAVRSRVREVLEGVDVITVRDRRSQQLLEEVGVTRAIQVTADPALLVEPEPLSLDEILRSEAIDSSARLIAFSVREPGPAAPDLEVEHYHRLLANAADFMADRHEAEVVFIPLERRVLDVQHSHAVLAQMRYAQRATVLKREYSAGQLLSLLKHFEFAVGMRLHSLILSALAGTPFVALPYATKVEGFLDDLRLEVPRLEHVSAGQLIATIDRAWENRERLRAHVRERLPEVQARARVNTELALGLLDATRSEPRRGPR